MKLHGISGNRRCRRAIAAASAASLLALIFVPQAPASKPEKVKVDTQQLKSNSDLTRFASISPGMGDVIVVAENAKLSVVRTPGINEIILHSNAPRNWYVKGSLIRQCGFAGERKGVAMLADALGSRAIVNGQVYLLPSGGVRGLQMGKDGVFINGQKMEPLRGSDVPGSGTGEDQLEIRVPESFSGNLKIGASGSSAVTIDSWKDGALECTLAGTGSLTAGKLENLSKAAIDNRGQGKAEIADVSAKVFVANITGQGQVLVKKGTAEVSNATVEGKGTMVLHGDFKNMQKSVVGEGLIEVIPQ